MRARLVAVVVVLAGLLFAGCEPMQNPYPPGSVQHKQWQMRQELDWMEFENEMEHMEMQNSINAMERQQRMQSFGMQTYP